MALPDPRRPAGGRARGRRREEGPRGGGAAGGAAGDARFGLANGGFAHPFQFVDVGDLDGVGESAPVPYHIQNLAEAEHAVALFMYMRLAGVAAHKVSIITPYNGQKDLICDVVQRRCGSSPFYGTPAKVATTDQFQGQQNDFIILSLVRTKAIGHLRDVRRLVVAVSRARLGLYVLGRRALFEPVVELRPTFGRLLGGGLPDKLHLLPAERHPTGRMAGDVPDGGAVVVEGRRARRARRRAPPPARHRRRPRRAGGGGDREWRRRGGRGGGGGTCFGWRWWWWWRGGAAPLCWTAGGDGRTSGARRRTRGAPGG